MSKEGNGRTFKFSLPKVSSLIKREGSGGTTAPATGGTSTGGSGTLKRSPSQGSLTSICSTFSQLSIVSETPSIDSTKSELPTTSAFKTKYEETKKKIKKKVKNNFSRWANSKDHSIAPIAEETVVVQTKTAWACPKDNSIANIAEGPVAKNGDTFPYPTEGASTMTPDGKLCESCPKFRPMVPPGNPSDKIKTRTDK